MFSYILKRILLSVFILFGVSVIVYALIRMLPNDYVNQKFASQLIQGTIKQEDVDRMKVLYGISDNSFWGILKGYFNWLMNIFRLDLGMSFQHNKPVSQVIGDSMWISFTIALIALVFQMLISIPLGIKSAVNQYGVADYSVTTLAMMGISLPSYFLAALLMSIFSKNLGWLPLQGLVTSSEYTGFAKFFDMLHHMILPMIVMVILSIGGLMRYTRTNMLEVMNADYIRTARAKGLSDWAVVYKHAFRNTLVPLVTTMAGILPGLFGGMMIIENVFAIPGIGQKAYASLISGDIPFIMGYNMFLAVLTVIGTLLSDLMYGVVDPRVKLVR